MIIIAKVLRLHIFQHNLSGGAPILISDVVFQCLKNTLSMIKRQFGPNRLVSAANSLRVIHRLSPESL